MQLEITRRQAIIRLAVLMGATAVGPRLLAGNFGAKPGLPAGYTSDDIALLDEIGETIIPTTDVPGAKSVGIGAFMAMMMNDCYRAPAQTAFRAGMIEIAQKYEARYGEKFVGGQAANRTAFLNEIYASARKAKRARATDEENGESPHYFLTMKDLTKLGYCTSEMASTKLFDWQAVPGRYDGNVPYQKKTRV